MDKNTGFSGKKTAQIVGISYRQLDYWSTTGLVSPSVSAATGSGSRRLYSYTDLLELKVIKTLLDAGIKLESVRDVFNFLKKQLGEDISSANLVIQGNNSVLTHNGEELIDLVHNGQGVLNILPLGNLVESIDSQIVELNTKEATDQSLIAV